MSGVVLISTYELGRQPFGLASPSAWLREAGADVSLQDLAVDDLDVEAVRRAALVGVYVPMHTATRLSEQVLERVRELNPHAHVCAYGLYAPMNAEFLKRAGATSVVGGEFEPTLVALYQAVASKRATPALPLVSLDRLTFRTPDRAGLPPLDRYASISLGADRRSVGYVEATRGCKHLCRHCPVVPVYGGQFRVVQPSVVMQDIRQQVELGARHITFGDPDFFNGPAHAMRIVRRLHDELPDITYDVTIKIEHLRKHAHLLSELAGTGCVLVTSAVESTDQEILDRFDKQHTREDFEDVLADFRAIGLALNPTFVAFTPWTTLAGYARFLTEVARLGLVPSVGPVQYSIRLLIPSGSRLLELEEVRSLVGDFSAETLAHPWSNPDPQVDALQERVSRIVSAAPAFELSRPAIFAEIWRAAAEAGAPLPASQPDLLGQATQTAIPQLSEPWYCCAEPTAEQFSRV